jgi:hypothetical protein
MIDFSGIVRQNWFFFLVIIFFSYDFRAYSQCIELESPPPSQNQSLCKGSDIVQIQVKTTSGSSVTVNPEESPFGISYSFSPDNKVVVITGKAYQNFSYTVQAVGCSGSISGTITVTTAGTAGTIGSDQTICSGTNAVNLTNTGNGTGTGTISYRWEKSTTSASDGFSTVLGQVTSVLSGPAIQGLTQNSWFRRSTVSVNGCESSPTSSVAITVLALPLPGSIGANQTVCNGETAANLSSIQPGSGSGTISYQWQRSVTGASTGFTDISGQTAVGLTGTSLANLTQNTWFHRIAVSTFNSRSCSSAASSPVAVTVLPVPGAGSIGTNQTVCNGESAANLTSSQDGTGGGTISYRWEKSTTDASSGFSIIAGQSSSELTGTSIQNLTQNSWYRRITISTQNSKSCAGSPTSVVAIVVQPIPNAGSIATNQTVCNGETPQALSNNEDGSGSGTISYRWERSTTNSSSGFSNIESQFASGLPASSIGSLTQNTWFRRVAISTLNGKACPSNASNVVAITVQAAIGPGSIGSDQTICNGENAANLANIGAGTGAGTISYIWESSTTGSSAGFAVISLQTGSGLAGTSLQNLTQNTWFRRIAVSTLNAKACSSVVSNIISVAVQSVPTPGVISSNQTLCNGEDASNLASTSSGTGQGTITYRWERSTTDAFIGFSQIAGQTGSALSGTSLQNLTQNTWFRRILVSTLNSKACSSSASNVIAITVQALVQPGTIATDQTICRGDNAADLSSSNAGSGSGTLSYRWERSTTDAFTGFSLIAAQVNSGLTGSSLQNLTLDTWYRRFAISTLNAKACSSTASPVIKVTVSPIPTPKFNYPSAGSKSFDGTDTIYSFCNTVSSFQSVLIVQGPVAFNQVPSPFGVFPGNVNPLSDFFNISSGQLNPSAGVAGTTYTIRYNFKGGTGGCLNRDYSFSTKVKIDQRPTVSINYSNSNPGATQAGLDKFCSNLSPLTLSPNRNQSSGVVFVDDPSDATRFSSNPVLPGFSTSTGVFNPSGVVFPGAATDFTSTVTYRYRGAGNTGCANQTFTVTRTIQIDRRPEVSVSFSNATPGATVGNVERFCSSLSVFPSGPLTLLTRGVGFVAVSSPDVPFSVAPNQAGFLNSQTGALNPSAAVFSGAATSQTFQITFRFRGANGTGCANQTFNDAGRQVAVDRRPVVDFGYLSAGASLPQEGDTVFRFCNTLTSAFSPSFGANPGVAQEPQSAKPVFFGKRGAQSASAYCNQWPDSAFHYRFWTG